MEKPPLPEVTKRLKDHDLFMRGIFSYIEFVCKILQYIIPSDLKPYIDFTSLKILSDVHISENLLLSQSDTIYEAALNRDMLPKRARKDKKIPLFRFCFLGEFKSSKPNVPIDFQIEDYVRAIGRKVRKKA